MFDNIIVARAEPSFSGIYRHLAGVRGRWVYFPSSNEKSLPFKPFNETGQRPTRLAAEAALVRGDCHRDVFVLK